MQNFLTNKDWLFEDCLQKSNIIRLTKSQVEYDIIGSNHNILVVKSQNEMDLEGAQRLIQEALRFGQERWKK